MFYVWNLTSDSEIRHLTVKWTFGGHNFTFYVRIWHFTSGSYVLRQDFTFYVRILRFTSEIWHLTLKMTIWGNNFTLYVRILHFTSGVYILHHKLTFYIGIWYFTLQFDIWHCKLPFATGNLPIATSTCPLSRGILLTCGILCHFIQSDLPSWPAFLLLHRLEGGCPSRLPILLSVMIGHIE